MMLVSTSFSRGHQRFTAAHELAHHLLRDPREIAGLLMPVDGLRDVIAGRPVEEPVIAELMRHFGVSFSALVYRLASSSVRLMSARGRDTWLKTPVSLVLRAANDPAPEDLITPDESRRIPLRLWRAAQAGPSPAARAISRHRQISAMSVSLNRTFVARLLSTSALSSSANGKSHCNFCPLSRRIVSAIVTSGRNAT